MYKPSMRMTVSVTVQALITECIITTVPFIINIHIDIVTIAARLLIRDITKKTLPTHTDPDIVTIAEKNCTTNITKKITIKKILAGDIFQRNPAPNITRDPITRRVFGDIIIGSRHNGTAEIEAMENKT
ncbi:MAG: hypothetical protein JRI32_07245 [Deltaproteobacteria bacterium]|nr:hypothetical protein [Deltaproteobacteria bacterium]